MGAKALQISEFELRQSLQSHPKGSVATSRHDIALDNYIERRNARVKAELKGVPSIAGSVTKLVRLLGACAPRHARPSEDAATSEQA